MESNTQENGNEPDQDNVGIKMDNDEEQLEQKISKLALNSASKLNKRKNVISEKLEKTHKQLQLKKIDLDCNSSETKQNDTIVQNSLELMAEKLPKAKRLQNSPLTKQVTNLPTCTTNKCLANESKEDLETIIDGFQQLVLKLISNDRKMLNVIGNAAKKISALKDLPLFEDIQKERRMPRSARKRRNDSILSDKEVNQSDPSGLLNNCMQNSVAPKENEKKHTSIKFVKYINSMIRGHLAENQKEKFEKYKCSLEHLDDLETFANVLVEDGLGTIVEAEIKVNNKNNRIAFVTMSNNRETNEKDGIVKLPVARRFAFDGDVVRAFVLNEDYNADIQIKKSSSHIRKESGSLSFDESEMFDETEVDSSNESENNDTFDTSMAIVSDKVVSRKAFVIKIVKQTELREVVGSINFTKAKSINFELYHEFIPHDLKIPIVFIPKDMCEEEIKNTFDEGLNGSIYVARVLDVDADGNCFGELVQRVGIVGNLQAEIKAILLHNGLKNLTPFEQKYNEMFEGPMPPPSDEDLKCREDLRKKCVFTIDPQTAKDLDDAVSVEKLNDNEYEIGVHISDVSYYLAENSELDNLVKHRATSVYLVNEVIHMLPTSLCFRCSLLPGEDKFAFSVFWKWHKEKEELSAPRFTRSIINSCSKFAYEDVQKIIDNPNDELNDDDLPDLFNEWNTDDIKWRVLLLHEIAQKLKAQRYKNGALSINNTKIRFQLDQFGEPMDFEMEDRQEANFLIEELMLLANQSAAKFIHDCFPDISILRNHGPPITRTLNALKHRLNTLGLDFNIASSKSLYESMQSIIRDASDPKAVETGLCTLLTKPMARARYFCSEGVTSEVDFVHYALSIPIYTHFTSPIRRYPDIMVHRLLAAALDYCPPPQRTTDELHQLAKICNDQKLNAKKAGEESTELFFKRYLKARGSITLDAVVIEIGSYAVNVVTIETGHSISIFYNQQKCRVDTKDVPNSVYLFERRKSSRSKKLQLFSSVTIYLVLRNGKICGFFDEFEIQPQKFAHSKEISKGNRILKNNDDNTPSNSSKSTIKKNKKKKQNAFLKFYAVND